MQGRKTEIAHPLSGSAWGDSLCGCWFEVTVVPQSAGSAVHLFLYKRDEETGLFSEVGCSVSPATADTVKNVADRVFEAGLLWLSGEILSSLPSHTGEKLH